MLSEHYNHGLVKLIKTKKTIESFHDKYFVHIWYTLGFILSASITLNPTAVEKAGLLLSLFVTFGAAVPVAFFIYTIYIFLSFIIYLIFEGVKEKSLRFLIMAIYFLLGLISFILSTIENA